MAEAAPLPPTPLDQILFHVRVIDRWRLPPREQQDQAQFSFFGLELELRGHIRDGNEETASLSLEFLQDSASKQQDRLEAMRGPFELVVKAQMPVEIATEQQKPLLHLFVPVQPQNKLARINKIHFLRHSMTGSEVVSELQRVLDSVSVARPVELTFSRHNHTQAAAKIRPFAARADVQQAQVAQFYKLQADESTWPEDRKRKKQFILQQMDFYREHYLYDHIAMQLQLLHEEIMGGGQWHAYEFEKALWYYHAPSGELYAEHPMRNNEKTRQLIGGVQLRTRLAARKLQHGARQLLQINRRVNTVLQRLLDLISDDILRNSEGSVASALLLQPYVDHLKANTGSKGRARKLWSKLRKTIPAKPVEPSAVGPTDVKDVQSTSEKAADQSESRQDRAEKEENLADDVANELLNVVCEEILGKSLADAFGDWRCASVESSRESSRPLIDSENTNEVPAPQHSSRPSSVGASSPERADCPGVACASRESTPEQELTNTASKVAVPVDTNEDDEDEDGEVRNWRSRLRLLKQHQQERKLSPKKNKPSHHSNVIPPSALDGPMLIDRSPCLLDMAASGVIASLKAESPHRRLHPDFDALEDLSVSPSWRRNGSFRSFHAFFTSPNHGRESPRLPMSTASRYASSPRLPAARAHASGAALPPPVAPRSDAVVSDATLKQAPSPPKKLPYIRRRRR